MGKILDILINSKINLHDKNRKKQAKIIYEDKDSGNSRALPKGVRYIRVVSKRDNRYKQVVVDKDTGDITHSEEEDLDQHKDKY